MATDTNKLNIKHGPLGFSDQLIRRVRVGPITFRRLCLLVVLALWEVIPHLSILPPATIASLSDTVWALVTNFQTFMSALAVTGWELAFALLVAYVLGSICGVLLGTVGWLKDAILPLVSSIYAVPLVVIYPLLTVWVGIGVESKVIFGTIYGVFPMLLATAAGVQTVDRQLLLAARSMGASRLQLLIAVVIPGAIPSIISGLRLGGAMCAIGVVVAEMMASTSGIGFLITQDRTMFNTPGVYAGILLVLVLVGVLDYIIRLVERRFAYLKT